MAHLTSRIWCEILEISYLGCTLLEYNNEGKKNTKLITKPSCSCSVRVPQVSLCTASPLELFQHPRLWLQLISSLLAQTDANVPWKPNAAASSVNAHFPTGGESLGSALNRWGLQTRSSYRSLKATGQPVNENHNIGLIGKLAGWNVSLASGQRSAATFTRFLFNLECCINF